MRGFLALLVVLGTAPIGTAAQDAAPEPAPSPERATTSVVVDDEQTELDRMQREAEVTGRPAPAEAVVDVEPREEVPSESLHHRNQVGARIGIGVPYIFAVRYGEGPQCDASGETFCRRLGPGLIDLELGFGISETVELSAVARLGLAEDEAAASSPVGFGLGARAYGSPHAMFKLFFGGRIMLDVTSSDRPEWKSVDVGLRGELGLQMDIVRYAGIYVQLGETVSVLRGLYFTTDLSGGVQARFP